MGQIGDSGAGYYLLTSILAIIFAVVTTLFLYHDTKGQGRVRLLAFWCVAPSMLFFLVYNWDILAVLSVVLAPHFIKQEKLGLASLFLAVGFSCKLYPAMFLLPLLLKKRTVSDWARILGVFTATTMVVNLFFMIANFDGWWYFFSFNRSRSPNPDSIWGVISYHIPMSVQQVNVASTLSFAVMSAILLWKRRHESIVQLCLILALAFLLTNKVFSPQYILWLLPFFVLLSKPEIGKGEFYAMELSNLLVLFTFLAWFFILQRSEAYVACQFFVIVRHTILLYILVKVSRIKQVSLFSVNALPFFRKTVGAAH